MAFCPCGNHASSANLVASRRAGGEVYFAVCDKGKADLRGRENGQLRRRTSTVFQRALSARALRYEQCVFDGIETGRGSTRETEEGQVSP